MATDYWFRRRLCSRSARRSDPTTSTDASSARASARRDDSETIPGAERARIPRAILGARWTSPLGAIGRSRGFALPEPEVVDDGGVARYAPTTSIRPGASASSRRTEAQTIARQKLEALPDRAPRLRDPLRAAAFVMRTQEDPRARRIVRSPPFNPAAAAAWSCWEACADQAYVTTERETHGALLLVLRSCSHPWRLSPHHADLFRNDWSLHMEEESFRASRSPRRPRRLSKRWRSATMIRRFWILRDPGARRNRGDSRDSCCLPQDQCLAHCATWFKSALGV